MIIRHSPLFVLAFSLTAFFQPLSSRAAERLIDSDLGKKGEGTMPYIAADPKDRERMPLKHPTGAVALPPSTLELKKDGVDALKEPLVVFTIGALEGGVAEAGAASRLEWRFTEAKLPMNGVYDVSYTLIPLKLPIRGGGRIQFILLDPSNKRMTDVKSLPSLAFNGDTFGPGRDSVKARENKPLLVRIRLDLTKYVYDAWIDGKKVSRKVPLGDEIQNGYPKLFLGSLVFGSEAGIGDKSGGSYAMGGMKLTWSKDSTDTTDTE